MNSVWALDMPVRPSLGSPIRNFPPVQPRAAAGHEYCADTATRGVKGVTPLDLMVGLAKTFVHESGWLPDLLGRVTYEIPTGPENSNQVPLPSNRDLLAFSLTATKRQDPLVFVATGGYTKSVSNGPDASGQPSQLSNRRVSRQ